MPCSATLCCAESEGEGRCLPNLPVSCESAAWSCLETRLLTSSQEVTFTGWHGGPHPVISGEPRHPGFLWVFVAGRAPSAPSFPRVRLWEGARGAVWGAPHRCPVPVCRLFLPSAVCAKAILLGADPQGQDWVSNSPVDSLHEAWGEAGPCMLCDLEQTLPLSGPELP